MRYKLQLLNNAAGTVDREWILHLPATVGRSPEVDVPIGDASISRRHCQFFLNGDDALSVRDFESMNGTYVDDVKITKRTVLRPNAVVRIGSISMRLEWTEEAVTEKPRFGNANVDTTQPMRIITEKDLKK